MKRSEILFLIILLVKIIGFSQTTLIPIENDSTITTEQLKIANLIFIEHESLLKERELMDKQLCNYISKSNILKQENILLLEQNSKHVERIADLDYKNRELNKIIKGKNNLITGLTIGGVSITVGLALFLLLR